MGQARKETKYKSPRKNILKRERLLKKNVEILKKLKEEQKQNLTK